MHQGVACAARTDDALHQGGSQATCADHRFAGTAKENAGHGRPQGHHQMLLPGAAEQCAQLWLADAGCCHRVGAAQRVAGAVGQGNDAHLWQRPGAVAALPSAALQGAWTTAQQSSEDCPSSAVSTASIAGPGAADAGAAVGAPDL